MRGRRTWHKTQCARRIRSTSTCDTISYGNLFLRGSLWSLMSSRMISMQMSWQSRSTTRLFVITGIFWWTFDAFFGVRMVISWFRSTSRSIFCCLRFRIIRSLFFLVKECLDFQNVEYLRVNFRELRHFYLAIFENKIVVFTWRWFSRVVDVCSMRLLLLVLRLGGFIDLRLVFESLFWSSEFDMSSLRYDDVSTLRCRALSCKKQGGY